ncbi:unnamed protein product [Ectocarpus sp. 12 AP-2014]
MLAESMTDLESLQGWEGVICRRSRTTRRFVCDTVRLEYHVPICFTTGVRNHVLHASAGRYRTSSREDGAVVGSAGPIADGQSFLPSHTLPSFLTWREGYVQTDTQHTQSRVGVR